MLLHRLRAASVLGLLAALAACSSPSPDLYTIAPVPGVQQATSPKVVVLQQIGLERYLERLQIVRSSEDYKLDVMSNDWWGEPLGAMLSRVLVDELQQRLPQSVVISEVGAVSAPADATVTLNIQRMDKDASGNLINPAIVEGQISGGVVQGIAGVLFEKVAYDANGQPLAATLKDYLVPTALDVPRLEYVHLCTPSTTPGGYKGVGEGGAMIAPPTLVNAINDALAPFGKTWLTMPLSPDRIVCGLADVEA